MKSPTAVLREELGDLNQVVILDRTYDIAAEVAVNPSADMEELLQDNAERVAKWGRLVSRCQNLVDVAMDKLLELRDEYFVATWDELEQKERAEMHAMVEDETEADADAQDKAAGDKTFKIRRSARLARRVTGGPSALRWRRNFSDDLVKAQANRQPEIVTAKVNLRLVKNQLNIAQSVLRAVEQRSRVISHFCAIRRDNTRF